MILIERHKAIVLAAADPGFPVGGGAAPLRGTNLRYGCFSAEMYAKMKELGPMGGGGAGSIPWICH